jgi:tetratricopeptide (TPR) repeat protein
MPASNMAGGAKSKWSQGGEPIDTSEMDNAIADAEKNVKAKPGDEAARKALGDAYFKRASALTDARQYAAALGDYRRALKNDPSNSEAKDWIAQIISIYDSMNKQYPPEGEEPPPLPFRKG